MKNVAKLLAIALTIAATAGGLTGCDAGRTEVNWEAFPDLAKTQAQVDDEQKRGDCKSIKKRIDSAEGSGWEKYVVYKEALQYYKEAYGLAGCN